MKACPCKQTSKLWGGRKRSRIMPARLRTPRRALMSTYRPPQSPQCPCLARPPPASFGRPGSPAKGAGLLLFLPLLVVVWWWRRAVPDPSEREEVEMRLLVWDAFNLVHTPYACVSPISMCTRRREGVCEKWCVCSVGGLEGQGMTARSSLPPRSRFASFCCCLRNSHTLSFTPHTGYQQQQEQQHQH